MPDSQVGKLIGKAGATINAIRAKSGASMSFGPRGEGKAPPPRLLVVRGAPEAVKNAASLAAGLVPELAFAPDAV